MPHSLLKAPPQRAFSLWTCLWGEFFPTGAPPDAEQFRTAAIGTSRAQAVARAAGSGARRGQRPSAASARPTAAWTSPMAVVPVDPPQEAASGEQTHEA